SVTMAHLFPDFREGYNLTPSRSFSARHPRSLAEGRTDRRKGRQRYLYRVAAALLGSGDQSGIVGSGTGAAGRPFPCRSHDHHPPAPCRRRNLHLLLSPIFLGLITFGLG